MINDEWKDEWALKSLYDEEYIKVPEYVDEGRLLFRNVLLKTM